MRRVHGISIDNGVVGGYLHSTEGDARAGKTGAIVVLETSNPSNNEELATIATQLATHVVGLKPEYIGKEEVPKSVIKERIAASKNPTKTQHHHILEGIFFSSVVHATLWKRTNGLLHMQILLY